MDKMAYTYNAVKSERKSLLKIMIMIAIGCLIVVIHAHTHIYSFIIKVKTPGKQQNDARIENGCFLIC